MEGIKRMLIVPLALCGVISAREWSPLQRQLGLSLASPNASHSLNVSTCPGYTLGDVNESENGLTASLNLAGASCNAYSTDIPNLSIEVTYETPERLHVNIFDSDKKQFTIPETVFARPKSNSTTNSTSDLVFNYENSPFSFWITRRSDPDATPLFDTRTSSLPPTPITPIRPDDNSTAFDGFPLVFEDQYLQISSALPLDTNIYGLGEYIASSGFRRDVAGPNGTIQTFWARDIADPVDQNMYGSHNFYLEHRVNSGDNSSQAHGVFLLNSAGSDVLLMTPPSSNTSIVEYRMLGGTLDFYFLSGPTPKSVVEQYSEVVGLPTWQPAWGFGFHLCRWGYANVSETREQVQRMKDANIPLETMWNDIDLYHAVRDFTADPVSFPLDEMRDFIRELASNNQHYIPIVDAAIPKQVNSSDIYDPYTSGVEQNVFLKNPDGSEYVGQVWPGYTVFPDWFEDNAQQWWSAALRNWSASGIEFSGIWLDMNEVSSFCLGSCGTGANLSNTSVPFFLPGSPESPVLGYPECYDEDAFGPSGNITVNGTLSCAAPPTPFNLFGHALGSGIESRDDLNFPPYAIHNGYETLSTKTAAVNATHANGTILEYDVHNLFGLLEEKATHEALLELMPGKRPFMISRSTFASSGKWTGHWLGDNYSLWSYMKYSIQGVLQFQLFQIPMVGPDTCGFNQNTDEELCNRWQSLSAFFPFYRNHSIKGALSQEPYRWDSVAEATRAAIKVRYSLLPYWTTLFANSSLRGTPPIRALFMEFPDEPALVNVDSQFLIGSNILVTPVLTPNVTSVDAIFPGRGNVTWRDWYNHTTVNASDSGNTTLPAPLGHINAHIRSGSVILIHPEPEYTIEETMQSPYGVVVSLDADGNAFGSFYVDDGESSPPGPSKTLAFSVAGNELQTAPDGDFTIEPKLKSIVILGVAERPSSLTVQGQTTDDFDYSEDTEELSADGLEVDLNESVTISWN